MKAISSYVIHFHTFVIQFRQRYIGLYICRSLLVTIGFSRVFQTFFIHFHSRNNSISSRKMSLNKSRFQFQTCVKQFQHCVIIFRNYAIDIRHSNYLIRPTLSMRIKSWKQFRLMSFIFTHLSSNFVSVTLAYIYVGLCSLLCY